VASPVYPRTRGEHFFLLRTAGLPSRLSPRSRGGGRPAESRWRSSWWARVILLSPQWWPTLAWALLWSLSSGPGLNHRPGAPLDTGIGDLGPDCQPPGRISAARAWHERKSRVATLVTGCLLGVSDVRLAPRAGRWPVKSSDRPLRPTAPRERGLPHRHHPVVRDQLPPKISGGPESGRTRDSTGPDPPPRSQRVEGGLWHFLQRVFLAWLSHLTARDRYIRDRVAYVPISAVPMGYRAAPSHRLCR
jgi:hypothetical protein